MHELVIRQEAMHELLLQLLYTTATPCNVLITTTTTAAAAASTTTTNTTTTNTITIISLLKKRFDTPENNNIEA